ncbi:acyl-CoA thioester hydrolase/BAAT C-terminal domain-containing protein [Henriciella sp.]|uniref:acyl-CoA thioester hydrolase/BAAT C-terminal domain-containing protein n=1 Tax=Henriciella sp. TaxID=1968823 RepID=UPI002604367A|nr:acyl-CoA thioester hydrolase/BAAT C-terminal domain-containing protein [Henriciella sp.]
MHFSIHTATLALCLFVIGGLAACQATSPVKAEAKATHEAAAEIIELREAGLIANYYPAARDKAGPGLLMLGGSEGGLNPAVSREAQALRDQGISVLQLSFYRAEGQPQNLEMVPLETFDRGLDWLKARGEVDADRIGIYGTSKGAEAALITATRHTEIAAIVAMVPSSVSWQGINWAFDGRPADASWSLGGAPYPALPYGAFDYETGLYSLYANGLKAVEEHPEAVIAIEKTQAPVLLICGSADALWPSCPMSETIAARAKERNGPDVTILSYPDAGHGAGGMPAGKLDPATAGEALDWGGTRRTNYAANRESWPQVVSFLTDTL